MCTQTHVKRICCAIPLSVALFMRRALDPQRVIQLACVRDYKLTSPTRERAT